MQSDQECQRERLCGMAACVAVLKVSQHLGTEEGVPSLAGIWARLLLGLHSLSLPPHCEPCKVLS